MFDRPDSGDRAVLVQLALGQGAVAERLSEVNMLAASAGAEVVAEVSGRRASPAPAFFVGKGKVAEIGHAIFDHGADLVIFNHELSPAQQRNLERELGGRVIDRNALILDIFALRAKSHEGKLQVELAQLEHLSTRLIRGWTHLERQKGGIGLRGPGETQLETDRRRIRELQDETGGLNRSGAIHGRPPHRRHRGTRRAARPRITTSSTSRSAAARPARSSSPSRGGRCSGSSAPPYANATSVCSIRIDVACPVPTLNT